MLDDSSEVFGVNESTLFIMFNAAIKIYTDWKHLLIFDHVRLNPQYLIMLVDAVAAKGTSLYNCWGFLDGTYL
jgi:hypothetical protein